MQILGVRFKFSELFGVAPGFDRKQLEFGHSALLMQIFGVLGDPWGPSLKACTTKWATYT